MSMASMKHEFLTQEEAVAQDPHFWLEHITSDQALEWVEVQNTKSRERFAATDEFAAVERSIREVLDSDDKIPMVSYAGGFLYNFWRDANHPRGLWRRTTEESYESEQPQWDVLLDVDALCGLTMIEHLSACLAAVPTLTKPASSI
jgi:prolyl oligopeptidase